MPVEGIRSFGFQTPPRGLTSNAAPQPAPLESIRPAGLPYVSPIIQYDNEAAIALLQFRDGETGDVEQQYPAERIVQEYRLRGRPEARERAEQDLRDGENADTPLKQALQAIAADRPGAEQAGSATAVVAGPAGLTAQGFSGGAGANRAGFGSDTAFNFVV